VEASINWGDGHTTTGTIRPTGNNNFSVSGANTYATAGVYTVKITITDSNGASTTVTTTITVSDARQYRDDDDGAPSITDDPWRGDLGTVLAVAEDDTTDGADGDARISALDELFTSPVAMGDAVLASL
jgi:PKD repeat protein